MSGHLIGVLSLMLSASALADGQTPLDRRVLVVIGNNFGDEGEHPLQYAEDDARRFHTLMTEAGNVAPDRAYLLLDENANVARRTLALAAGRVVELRASGHASLIVYVSSHADADELHLNGSRLPLEEIRRIVIDSGADLRLVIIDACRTAVVAQTRGGRPVQDVQIASDLGNRVEGDVWITSSGSGEPAQEWAYLRGSLFSHHLFAGLRGLANLDGDARVTLAEAYAYAYRKTTAASAASAYGAQHPSFDVDMRGWGEWTFARPSDLGAKLVMGESVSGSILVTDSRNELVAEIVKPAGERTELAVRPGLYRLVRPGRRYVQVADVNLAYGGTRVIEEDLFVRTFAERAALRGGQPIVPRPWRAGAAYRISRGLVDGVSVAHGAHLSLSREFDDWIFGSRLQFSSAGFRGDTVDVRSHDVGLELSAARRFWIEFLALDFGLSGGALLIRQTYERDDQSTVNRVFGLQSNQRNAVLPFFGLKTALSLPMTDTCWINFEMKLDGLRIRTDDGAHLRALPSAALGVSWAF